MDNNYLYARVRNVGCATAPANAKLRLYWTLASTGEKWPEDWTTGNFLPNPILPVGREVTSTPLSIPVLEPGASVLLHQEWEPQNPMDYDPFLNELNACILARIEETSSFPFGMTINEIGGPISTNVRNNNNIITRNLVFKEINTQIGNGEKHMALVANPELTSQYFTLQLIDDKTINPHFAGNRTENINGSITLDPVLYARWASGDHQGTYTAKDDFYHTIYFYDNNPIELKNILLYPGESFVTEISFEAHAYPDFLDAQFNINFRQIGEVDHMIYGNITYQITTIPEYSFAKQMMKKIRLDEPNLYNVYPNPAQEKVTIEYQGKNQEVAIVFMILRAEWS